MAIRQPIVADQFYREDFAELNEQIESCFKSKLGPSVLPGKRTAKRILGMISPHAGYQFSGPCAAWAYKEVAEAEIPETFILLGPNHSYPGDEELIFNLDQDWQTPLGKIQLDKELGKKLLEKLPFATNNPIYHSNEHSIEVQLPFLQYATRDKLNDLKILPIMVNFLDLEHAKAFAKALTELTTNITIIASSDFTHYGPIYGYTPFTTKTKDKLHNQDTKAINYIRRLDSKSFLKFIKKTDTTICGASPVIYLLETLKLLDSKTNRLLIYYTSGDITKDYTNAVGYASIIFEK